jgi:hypothetical protein
MTLNEVNAILHSLQPAAKKAKAAQKKGRVVKLGLRKLTVRTGKKD